MAYPSVASDIVHMPHPTALTADGKVDPQLDARTDFRQRTYLGGLMVTERGAIHNCIIRNLSLKGAMIQTLANPGVPDVWRLVDIKNGVGFQVRTVWRETPRAGIRFIDRIDLTKDVPVSWQATKTLWSSVARCNPVIAEKDRVKSRLKYSVSASADALD